MTFDEAPELLTVKDLQALLGISKGLAYQLVGPGGKLPSIRLSERNIRVPKHALQAWLDATTDSTPQESATSGRDQAA